MPLARSSDGSLGVRVVTGTAPMYGFSGGKGVSINVGGVNIINQTQQKDGESSRIDTGLADRQLKAAITATVMEQASNPGTALWSILNKR